MNQEKEVLQDFLRLSKNLLKSNLSADQKVDIIRKDAFAFKELAMSATDSAKVYELGSHFKELYMNGVDYKTQIEQRSKGAAKLLQGLPRRAITTQLKAEKFLKENKFFLDPDCSGKFESCTKNEVNIFDLKVFQKAIEKVPPSNQIPSPTRKKVSLSNSNEISTPPRKIIKSDAFGFEHRRFPALQLPIDRPVSSNAFSAAQTSSSKKPGFRTAKEELIIQNIKKHINGDSSSSNSNSNNLFNYGASKKSLGARRNVRSGFVPPIRQEENSNSSSRCTPPDRVNVPPTEPLDERLRNIDPKMIELITNEIMHKNKPIDWNDIAGLEYAKSTIKEAVVWPLLRPDIFTGLRRPPRGILLFGPPGTGKTLIGKCIASQSHSTFFSISASSLTSKWIGDGEKMVRALFAVAAVNQPSVVFIDEIDSLLSQRSESEHESSRRLKTEFLVQLDGASTSDDERILIVGATNRPQELDEAARRRLVRRLYIPLPELSARVQILTNLLKTVRNSITEEEILDVGNLTNGYSGADMETLCREASMEPIRSIPPDEIPFFSEENVRPVKLNDFHMALKRVRASVTQNDLQQYADWNRIYGAGH